MLLNTDVKIFFAKAHQRIETDENFRRGEEDFSINPNQL